MTPSSATSLPASSSGHGRPPDEYSTLLRELAAIGNNINQIAHWANARKSIHEPEIVEAAILANRAWRLVKDTL